jgi:mannose-1-phosphate guanylyltransferase
LPKTSTVLSSLPPFSSRNFSASLAKAFPLCENISIDYALLEKADNVVGVPCNEFGWNDVGSWNAVYDLLPTDAGKNASRSPLVAIGSEGNFVDCGGKLVALLGVKDLIVVDTPDALLVARKRDAQKVGAIVSELEKRKREDLL